MMNCFKKLKKIKALLIGDYMLDKYTFGGIFSLSADFLSIKME